MTMNNPFKTSAYLSGESQKIAKFADGGEYKEGCNRGHGLSAAIKLGSLSSRFFVEKTRLHNLCLRR